MNEIISVTGYAPDKINYCPECGAYCATYMMKHSDGRLLCTDCGLSCYIVEADDSHSDESEGWSE